MSPTIPLSSLLRCARCSYEWIPRKDQLPKRCPKCRSIKWNDPHLRVTCLRCGHTWNSHNGAPKRCPSCPLCSSKDWASDREVDIHKISPQMEEVDSVLEGLIMGEYRKGRTCVDISIAQGIPYSLVFEIVRRNTANINIKV